MSFSNNHQETWKRYRLNTHRLWKLHTPWGHIGKSWRGREGEEREVEGREREGKENRLEVLL